MGVRWVVGGAKMVEPRSLREVWGRQFHLKAIVVDTGMGGSSDNVGGGDAGKAKEL